jgi:hypothetical protein
VPPEVDDDDDFPIDDEEICPTCDRTWDECECDEEDDGEGEEDATT